MAAGEYVSVRSQRELFEYQIGLERDELDAVPRGRGAGARADLRREGAAAERGARLAAQASIADPEHALDTLAREELGLNPDELGSPWGAAISSFVSFAAGALLPLAPFIVAPGAARAADRRSASPRSRCSASARCCRCSPDATRCCSGARMLALGALAGGVTFAGRPPRRRRAWLIAAARAAAAAASPGARSRCGCAIPGSSPARSTRVDGAPASGDDRRRCRRRRRVPRPRRVLAGVADPRARLDASIRARRSTPRSSRGASRARSRRAPAMLDARHTAAGSSTANRTACPASSPTATATSSSCSCSSAGARALARRDRRRAGRGDRRGVRLRALGRRRARARRARRRASGVAARRAARRRSTFVEDGLRVPRRRRRRPEDRLLPRPARQPAPRCARSPPAARCSTCSATRAASRWRRWPAARRASLSIDSSADALALARANLALNPALDAERARMARGRRVRRAAQAARRGRAHSTSIVARPAEVRADRGARRARGTRVQGRQPAGR